jgi:hypothetical protein
MRALAWVSDLPRRLKAALEGLEARFGRVRVIACMAVVALLLAECARALLMCALGA